MNNKNKETDLFLIKHLEKNSYTLKQTARRLNVSESFLLEALHKEHYPFFKYRVHAKDFYFDKAYVDLYVATGCCEYKHEEIMSWHRKCMLRSTQNVDKAYAITIAFNGDIRKNKPHVVQPILDRICRKLSRKIYGKNYEKHGEGVSLEMIAEGGTHNLHLHGYLLLSHPVRNKNITTQLIEDLLTQYMKDQYIRSTVQVDHLYDLFGWEKYIHKSMADKYLFRNKEFFYDDTSQRYYSA